MSQTERLFRIEQLIKARRMVSFATLLDELEVSRTTLKRDRTFPRDRMRAPVEDVVYVHIIPRSLCIGRNS